MEKEPWLSSGRGCGILARVIVQRIVVLDRRVLNWMIISTTDGRGSFPLIMVVASLSYRRVMICFKPLMEK